MCGDNIDSQLIGLGIPSSINIGLEGPAVKRHGSIAETQWVSQTNIFDHRHYGCPSHFQGTAVEQ